MDEEPNSKNTIVIHILVSFLRHFLINKDLLFRWCQGMQEKETTVSYANAITKTIYNTLTSSVTEII